MFGKRNPTHRLTALSKKSGPRRVTASGLSILLACGALGLLLGFALPVSSQTRAKMKAPPVQDLMQLIEAARQAGLTEEQVRQLTLRDEEGNSINAWEYLQAQLARKQKEEALQQEMRTRVYLTVRDVFADLRKSESSDLSNLRDQLPYLK